MERTAPKKTFAIILISINLGLFLLLFALYIILFGSSGFPLEAPAGKTILLKIILDLIVLLPLWLLFGLIFGFSFYNKEKYVTAIKVSLAPYLLPGAIILLIMFIGTITNTIVFP